MKIAIDISPLKTGRFLQHRVRGTGFYIENLKNALIKYYPENKYIFFVRGEKLPKDVDLVHYPYFEPFFLALPLFMKQKIVVTVHDLTPLVFSDYFPKGIKGEIKWRIQRYLLQKADAVIADSKCSKGDIIKYAGISDTKVNVVYLAAGEEFHRIQNLRKKYNLPEKFVLYVGDVTWNKNLPRLIEGIKKTDAPLLMVGKALAEEDFDRGNFWNKDLAQVQNMIKNQKSKLKNQITTLGFIPQEDLIALYNLATIFVMPSLYEGFGLPVLEAMSCGCPVITTKEGSMPEVAGDAAFYVNAYDIDSIKNGIEKVFNDEKLQKELSEKGMIQSKKFSWEKTAQETIKVYQKVARGTII